MCCAVFVAAAAYLERLSRCAIVVNVCCEAGFHNRVSKKTELRFFCFPQTDKERYDKWAAAVKRKDWSPTQAMWIPASRMIVVAKTVKNKRKNSFNLEFQS